MGKRSDGLLVAWRFYDCELSCSSMLWLLELPRQSFHFFVTIYVVPEVMSWRGWCA